MALRYSITKSEYDKLSDEIKAEYTVKGDNATLDITGGPDPKANDKLTSERDRRRAAEDRAGKAETRVAELEDAGTDVAAAKAAADKEIKKANDERDAATKKYTDFASKSLKDGVARDLASKLAGKNATVLMPHLAARVSVDMTGDEPKTVFLDKDGKASTMTADDLAKEFRDNKDFSGIVMASNASGGGSSRQSPPGNGLPSHTPTQPPQAGATVNLAGLKGTDLVAAVKERSAARQNAG